MQLVKHVVPFKDLRVVLIIRKPKLVKLGSPLFPAVLHCRTPPGPIDQDAAHRFGGSRKEMPPVFPANIVANHTQIRFMN